MQPQPRVEALIPALIASLTDGAAKTTILSSPALTVFQVSIPDREAGKLIGKQGSLASALRRILVGFSGRDKRSYRLEIM